MKKAKRCCSQTQLVFYIRATTPVIDPFGVFLLIAPRQQVQSPMAVAGLLACQRQCLLIFFPFRRPKSYSFSDGFRGSRQPCTPALTCRAGVRRPHGLPAWPN